MSNGFKSKWDNHQHLFLELMLKELGSVDANFKQQLEILINHNKPDKITLIARIKVLLGISKEDPAVLSKRSRYKYFLELFDELYGKIGRTTYLADKLEYKSDCLLKISNGISISGYVPSLSESSNDIIKAERLIDSLQNPNLDLPTGRVLGQLCKFQLRQGFDFETIATLWLGDLKRQKPVTVFDKFNETLGFAALDKVFADAGGVTSIVTAGTSCSHAGRLPKDLVFDDKTPCWTTTNPNKLMDYAATAVSDHVRTPVIGTLPQIIKGIVVQDLHCAVLHKTSFEEFIASFCDNSHDNVKPWIARWCAFQAHKFDGLTSTNGGVDELVIMNPLSKVRWTPWITLPTTQAQFDAMYGKPPSLPSTTP